MSPKKKILYCSFCSASSDDVKALVAGPAVYICDACIELCTMAVEGKTLPTFPGWNEMDTDALLERLVPAGAAANAAHEHVSNIVDVLRARDVTWARIGEELGVTRQAAQARFGT